jgi:hypothetical protein
MPVPFCRKMIKSELAGLTSLARKYTKSQQVEIASAPINASPTSPIVKRIIKPPGDVTPPENRLIFHEFT